MRRVVVTGIGLITPIGIGKEEFWKNNKEGKSRYMRYARTGKIRF